MTEWIAPAAHRRYEGSNLPAVTGSADERTSAHLGYAGDPYGPQAAGTEMPAVHVVPS